MPKKPTDEELREELDYRARRQLFLVRLWEGDQQNKTDFYKQIMLLSIAGLGYNLAPRIKGDNNFAWIPDNAWQTSTLAFALTTILILVVFFVRSWHYSVSSELSDPGVESTRGNRRVGVLLGAAVNFLTIAITLSFVIAVVAIIRNLS